MTSEQDREQAHQLMLSGGSRYFDPSLEDAIAVALSIARREARQAALVELLASIDAVDVAVIRLKKRIEAVKKATKKEKRS